MSAPYARDVLRIPGKLVKTPTNLSAAFPYGGTELGVVRDMAFQVGHKTDLPEAEEFKAIAAVLNSGESPVFACVLRSWDNDMISTVWHNIQTSTHGQVGMVGKVSGSGITRAGANLTSRGIKLLFAPQADDIHPSILIYNAVPMLAESSELQLSIGREMGLALIFRGLPDSTGRTFVVDQRSNLTL